MTLTRKIEEVDGKLGELLRHMENREGSIESEVIKVAEESVTHNSLHSRAFLYLHE